MGLYGMRPCVGTQYKYKVISAGTHMFLRNPTRSEHPVEKTLLVGYWVFYAGHTFVCRKKLLYQIDNNSEYT